MRWKTGRRSQNIEDRRGIRVSRGIKGGGIGAIVIALVAMYFGVDPSLLLQVLDEGSSITTRQAPAPRPASDDPMVQFVSVVLADIEDTWHVLLPENGRQYIAPKLVLFSGAVQSACGFANAAVGPFYCPGDQKVYIDLSFYQDLKQRFHAPGDFAQAYVIAHEIGHHVQKLMGISEKVQALRSRLGTVEANALSVRLELQADCFAGIWAHHANRSRQILEEGDLDEALNAASAIGDDRLQKQARGYVTPDSFTHGTSQQRVRWFSVGWKYGSMQQCDTFAAESL